MSLQCGVWGIFPDDSLAPIKTSLDIDILDDICFWKLKDAAKLLIFLDMFGWLPVVHIIPIGDMGCHGAMFR